MKNLNAMFPALLVLITFLFTACGEQAKTKEEAPEPVVEAPDQIISIDDARVMFENYGERRAAMIQKFEDSINISKKDTAQFDVARYTYYDYETIKQYMAYIEQEAASVGVEISSLRFYFSNYPDQERFANGKPVKHPRQNSFFIIPATELKGDQYGFTTEETADGKKKVVLLNGQLQVYNPDDMGFNDTEREKAYAGFTAPNHMGPMMFNGGGTVLNEGNSAPPPHK